MPRYRPSSPDERYGAIIRSSVLVLVVGGQLAEDLGDDPPMLGFSVAIGVAPMRRVQRLSKNPPRHIQDFV
jgi:hypothetical protein